jgi:3' exoribonuclease, RNase T-like
MSYYSIDIESDGPIPSKYSMIAIGAVIVEPTLSNTFYAELRPISDLWIPEALAVSGFSREDCLLFEEPDIAMLRFSEWVKSTSKGRPLFISDNNGFDWQFVNYYFHYYCGENPFGFSSTNLGSLYKGLVNDCFASFKHLRKTEHTHNALDDAKGNVEALLTMKNEMGLKISLK